MLRKMTGAVMVPFLFGVGGPCTSLSYGETAGQLLAHNEHGKKKAAREASTSGAAKDAEAARTAPMNSRAILKSISKKGKREQPKPASRIGPPMEITIKY